MKTCLACGDRRVRPHAYDHDGSDAPGICVAWQCLGCGAILEPWLRGTRVVGFAPVVFVGGLKGDPPARARA